MSTTFSSPSTSTTRADVLRRCLLAGTLAIAPVVLVVAALVGIDDPDTSGTAHVDAIAPDRDRFFVSLVLASLGMAMLAIGSYGLTLLARRRGGRTATAGWFLTAVGGTSAAASLFLYGVVLHLVTDPSLDREAMGAVDQLGSDSVRIGVAFVVGFLGVAIGLLLLAVGLWRARTVPTWMAGLLGLGAVLTAFAYGQDQWASALLLSPLLVLVGLAVELVRSERTIVLPGAPDDASTITHGDHAHGQGHGRGLLHRSR